jgi:hypothetical protein
VAFKISAQEFWVFMGHIYRDKEELSVSLCVFVTPLQQRWGAGPQPVGTDCRQAKQATGFVDKPG